MAIAGTGGWVPSCRVVVRDGGVVATGIVQNKPPELVFSDENRRAYGSLADGIERLALRQPIQVDMTDGQFLRLVELWRERTRVRALPEWVEGAGAGDVGVSRETVG